MHLRTEYSHSSSPRQQPTARDHEHATSSLERNDFHRPETPHKGSHSKERRPSSLSDLKPPKFISNSENCDASYDPSVLRLDQSIVRQREPPDAHSMDWRCCKDFCVSSGIHAMRARAREMYLYSLPNIEPDISLRICNSQDWTRG
jgi:hypothetical protein